MRARVSSGACGKVRPSGPHGKSPIAPARRWPARPSPRHEELVPRQERSGALEGLTRSSALTRSRGSTTTKVWTRWCAGGVGPPCRSLTAGQRNVLRGPEGPRSNHRFHTPAGGRKAIANSQGVRPRVRQGVDCDDGLICGCSGGCRLTAHDAWAGGRPNVLRGPEGPRSYLASRVGPDEAVTARLDRFGIIRFRGTVPGRDCPRTFCNILGSWRTSSSSAEASSASPLLGSCCAGMTGCASSCSRKSPRWRGTSPATRAACSTPASTTRPDR